MVRGAMPELSSRAEIRVNLGAAAGVAESMTATIMARDEQLVITCHQVLHRRSAARCVGDRRRGAPCRCRRNNRPRRRTSVAAVTMPPSINPAC